MAVKFIDESKMVRPTTAAYVDGYDTRLEGKDRAVPSEYTDVLAGAWLEGWDEADDELT